MKLTILTVSGNEYLYESDSASSPHVVIQRLSDNRIIEVTPYRALDEKVYLNFAQVEAVGVLNPEDDELENE